MKMKVLYLTYSPSPYRVDFFRELGDYVELTVCYETTPIEDKTNRNSNWYDTSKTKFEAIYLKNKYVFNKYYSFDFIKLLKLNKYDIIVLGSYTSITAIISINYLKMKKIPFFLSIDGGFPKEKESKIKYLVKKNLLNSATYYLSSGKNANKYLEYYGVNESNIFNYPFTSLRKKDLLSENILKEDKTILRKKLSIPNKFTFISVGQFIDRKGMDIIINATKLLNNDFQVIIIGDKPTDKYLNLIDTNNNKIIFENFKPKLELFDYLKASDVFILATREDIWGLVINEALSVGLPVITTNKCGAGLDLINNFENGFIIESDNEKELSEKMNYFLNNKKIISKMSNNALKIIKDYTIENEAKAYFNALKIIADKNVKR